MPQLNPCPWFMILLSSWTIMLLILMPMIMHTYHLSPPTNQDGAHTTYAWNWTWQ
uniref:ATP synthase complex subunit 8 n=1 Tax=Tenuidactylus dadunensis TaxID=3079921 RepID=A0AA96UW60_9SAUR|nr:ATP synthase F0 subunit 8 [Tenuidactylus dadunensis]WNX96097.1 ATP synthase F0 subunit 8 [Tenuidactylus dadunensis]